MRNILLLTLLMCSSVFSQTVVEWTNDPPTAGQDTRVILSVPGEPEIETLCVMFNYSSGEIETIDPDFDNGCPGFREIWFEAPYSRLGSSYCVVTVWYIIIQTNGDSYTFNTSRTVRLV